MARVLARLRSLAWPASPPQRTPAPVRSRRKSARAAVWTGVVAFAALTAGLAGALDTVKPEWRDPEFALRLNQVRQWRAKAPHRPLVVAFGSSRTQMGLDPAAMGFPDEPGSPIVYNFGYRGARPLGAWLHLNRVLDSGVKPDAVLIQLAAPELRIDAPAERQYDVWAPRFSRKDIRRLAPFAADDAVFHRAWRVCRLKPWVTYRQAILSDLLPEWNTASQRQEFEWERMDKYGYSPHPRITVAPDVRLRLQEQVRARHAGGLKDFKPAPIVERLYRDLLARCRAEGIAVAYYWVPLSPTYRSWYPASALAAIEEYDRWLGSELGVTRFPAPEHLSDDDFADGHHLIRHGAAKYSRWLADTHLKPWLAARGLAK
jgi:hypothetical protein